MTISVSNETKNAMLNGLAARIDSGLAGALIKVYSGSRPLPGNPITIQSLLFTVVLDYPSVTAIAGELNLAVPAIATNLVSGTATWGRLLTSTDNFILDFDVSNYAGTEELRISNTIVVVPGTTNLLTLTFGIG